MTHCRNCRQKDNKRSLKADFIGHPNNLISGFESDLSEQLYGFTTNLITHHRTNITLSWITHLIAIVYKSLNIKR